MSIGSLTTAIPHAVQAIRRRSAPLTYVHRTAQWLCRPRRVVGLLLLIWGLNGLDLGYTIAESNQRLFRELNPVAAHVLQAPPYALVLYKASLVAIGSAILIRLRRERVAELSCWFLLTVYCYVSVRWLIYYDHITAVLSDPAVVQIDPFFAQP